MSKRVGNRTGREAKRRARRHARKSAEGAALKAWLQHHAPGALLFCRGGAHPIGLRTLARVCLNARPPVMNARPRLLLEHDDVVDAFVYGFRYLAEVRRPPRVLYMDGI